MALKKADLKRGAKICWYALQLVYTLKPRLLIVSVIQELFNRSVPFAVAVLSARIVTELPALTETASRQQSIRLILIYMALILGINLLETLVRGGITFYRQRHEIDLNAMINSRLTEKFARLPFEMYEQKEVADNYELAQKHANHLADFALNQVSGIIGSLYALTLATVALLHFSVIFVVALALVMVPRVLLEIKVNQRQRDNWRQNTVARRMGVAYEWLTRPSSIKDTRLFGLLEYVLEKGLHYGKKAELEQLHIDQKAERPRFAMTVLENLTETGALGYVVWLIYIGRQPIGQFVYVQQIMTQFSGSMSQLLWIIRDFDDFLAGASEFYDFMALPIPEPGNVSFNALADIAFHDVTFSYPGSKLLSLDMVSVAIPRGKTIAIVGENGAGKTTLVKLLMKLYRPSAGSICVADKALDDLNDDDWHESLGVLFQDFVTFDDFTIRENVWFGDISKQNDRRAIIDALKKANAYDFVMALPKGIDTYIGKYMDEENGTNLSGGQLQRLAIARVIFRDPEILIMDEPTSAVDAKAEYEIFKTLEQERRGKTTILISHRFSTVRRADYIYVLEKGRLIEAGDHSTLYAKQGKYRQMFDKQAEGYQ